MTALEKMAIENRQHVMKLIDYRTEDVARRDNLDLKKPADLVTAYSTVCTDPDRYNVAFNSDVTDPIYMYPNGISVGLLQAYGTRNPDLNRLQRFVESILTGMSQLVLFKPWIYLIICISVIITCVKFSVPKKREIALITGSGLTHALGVFLFAPAPEYRYSHYTVYAGTLGLILLLRAILLTEQRIISRGTRLKIITSPARI